ncbi:hypothetical protein [Ramlibacter sp. WS9]|uniref:hypothetical protein n=1 Tax=Ramlibacter sp. WS9 TaxID=1882741 RepID=UPI0011418434|nr:hypothetical protein [Ramlibacter sp. WS9]ROZ62553.1 hypothetical protein EEB15_30810 [Ramlibacter sp. WS9]
MTEPTDEGREGRALHQGRFEGRNDFQQLVRDALACAASEGWRQIILCDASFEDWPLGERAVAESLQAWSASGRHCTLIARKWDDVIRRHARFVTWRRTWSHIIDARACPSADSTDLPSAIWSPGWAMQRLDLTRSNGYCGSEPERRVLLRQNLNEWLQRSTPAFPANTAGL